MSWLIALQEFIAEILGIPSMKSIKKNMPAASRPGTASQPSTARSTPGTPVKGTIRARELQQIIRQKLERAIADPGHLRDVFGRMDRDGSGVLTFDDFALACEGYGIMLPTDAKAALFEQFDQGNQGFLSYSDFVNRVALVPHDIVDIPHPHAPEARCSTPQVLDEVRDRIKEGILARRDRIEGLFRWFDKSGTKKITYGAFRDQLRALHLPLQDHHIKSLWQGFGAAKKGHLDFRSFVENMLDFNLAAGPAEVTPLQGWPSTGTLPDKIPRSKPVFDLGHSRPMTNDPKTQRAISIEPFEGRAVSRQQGRPGTAPSRGVVHKSGQSIMQPKAASRGVVDVFAQADQELGQLQSKGASRQRVDHSFRGDKVNQQRRGSGQRSESGTPLKWDSSRTINA